MTGRVSISRVEVKGEAIQAIVHAMSLIEKRALKILAENGITPLENEKWYPMARLVEVTRQIQAEIGPNTIRAVGRRLVEILPSPPPSSSLEETLNFVNVNYQQYHRGTGVIGGYRCERMAERKLRMRCDDPYPCDFDKGLLEALGERYRPKDSLWVRVEHLAGACRETGSSACSYDIVW